MPDDILPAENFVRPFVIWDRFQPIPPHPRRQNCQSVSFGGGLAGSCPNIMPPCRLAGA